MLRSESKVFAFITSFRPTLRQLGACFLLLFASHAVNAAGFTINEAHASFNQDALSVDAKFELQLSEAVSEALHNGVSIQLLTTLDLFTTRPYIWDPRIAQWAFTQNIRYHSLTNRYILTSPQYQGSRSYSSLSDLFSDIESFRFQSDILGDTLPASKRGYKLQLRIALDNSVLPAPLRVMTYISPAWKLRSKIYEWSISSKP
jgi:hypothetical protein